uniref:Uncharacterized protein n=1 Tax=Arundo donax TaxID=35708 RepID=A0A0A9A6B4_ARUDO
MFLDLALSSFHLFADYALFSTLQLVHTFYQVQLLAATNQDE